MHRIPQIDVLATRFRALGRKFRVDERASQRYQTTNSPGSQNQKRSVDLLRHNIGICEDARANDPAHYDHRGVEETETASEMRFRLPLI